MCLAEATYKWLVQLPVAAVSLDFKGVPGSDQGCHTARLIAKHGFPQVWVGFVGVLSMFQGQARA